MAYTLIWSPSARFDLRDVLSYISEFDSEAASRFGLSIFDSIERLVDFPELGRPIKTICAAPSFLIDKERGILEPKGYDKVSDGSWFVSMKVENDAVWESVKNGTFKGFSVEGVFDKEEDQFIKELKKWLELD